MEYDQRKKSLADKRQSKKIGLYRAEVNDHIGAERSEGKCRKTRQIRMEKEHYGYIEDPCQEIRAKHSKNI